MKVNNYRKVTFTIGAFFILLGLVTAFIFPGFNWAIDFTGGYETQISIGKEFDTADVEKTVEDTLGFKASSVQKSSDADHPYMVTISCKELTSEQRTDLFNAIVEEFDIPYDGAAGDEAAAAEDAAAAADETTDETAAEDTTAAVSTDETAAASTEDKATLSKSEIQIVDENISPTIGNEMKRSAIISAIIAILLMLLYITFRFELLSGLVAVIMLFHDIMVVIAAYAILRIPVGSTFIAVVLTILGYSINATIIVFDRVRENVRANPKIPFRENVDKGVAQTLTRSIYTNLTTLFTIVVLLFVGVDSIKEFALPIVIGLLAGTFSSVFLAGPLWTVFRGKNTKAVK